MAVDNRNLLRRAGEVISSLVSNLKNRQAGGHDDPANDYNDGQGTTYSDRNSGSFWWKDTRGKIHEFPEKATIQGLINDALSQPGAGDFLERAVPGGDFDLATLSGWYDNQTAGVTYSNQPETGVNLLYVVYAYTIGTGTTSVFMQFAYPEDNTRTYVWLRQGTRGVSGVTTWGTWAKLNYGGGGTIPGSSGEVLISDGAGGASGTPLITVDETVGNEAIITDKYTSANDYTVVSTLSELQRVAATSDEQIVLSKNIAIQSNTNLPAIRYRVRGNALVIQNDSTLTIQGGPSTDYLDRLEFHSDILSDNFGATGSNKIIIQGRIYARKIILESNLEIEVQAGGFFFYEEQILNGFTLTFTGSGTNTQDFWDNTGGTATVPPHNNLTGVQAATNAPAGQRYHLGQEQAERVQDLTFEYIGVWNSAITYGFGQIVLLNNRRYISRVRNNLNNNPFSSPLNWADIGLDTQVERTVQSLTNPATITPDASTTYQINANAQAQALTINIPTNPADGLKIIYRIRASATSALNWSASFLDLKGNLPTSAPINKSIYVGVIYNGFNSSWEVVSVVEQA